MNTNNYHKMQKAVGSIEELLGDEEEASTNPRSPISLTSGAERGGSTPASGAGTGPGQGPLGGGKDYYHPKGADEAGEARAPSTDEEEEEDADAPQEEKPYSPARRRVRPGPKGSSRPGLYPARPGPRQRPGDRRGLKPVGAFAGLCLGLGLWYLGGLCFSFTATSFKLTAMQPVLLNYWPWLLYGLISYVQAVYLPRSIRDLRVLPWYILVGVTLLTAVDITGSSGGALEFWAGKSFRWGSYSFGFQLTDAHTIVLSLVCGGVISLGAEPVTRFFWGELTEL